MLDAQEEYHDLPALLEGKARKNEERPAVRTGQRTVSYRELYEGSLRAAQGLKDREVRPGDKVALFLYNSPEFLQTWYGTNLLGGVMVPLNTALKGDLLRYELLDSDAKVMVSDLRLYPEVEKVRTRTGLQRVVGFDATGRYDDLPRSVEAFQDLGRTPANRAGLPKHQPSDPAAILYTSGTTGPPKGVVIPHEKYLSTARAISTRSELTPESVLFTELPLFHCNAQEMSTHTALLNDLTVAFTEWFKASDYWEVAQRMGATHVSLLISMVNVLFKQPPKPSDREHPVRVALTAGTQKGVWRPFEERFGLKIVELYGMTECGCTTLMNPPDRVRLGSIGVPLDFVEAQVVDEMDRPVAPGIRGELVVRPRRPYSMMLGYYKKPEQTVEAWRNLWFHTGDYVWRDEDGYYYFVERKKDVIRRRGENIAPYDVEQVLNQHPMVFETVVVGVPSALGEEDVKAYVQLEPGAQVEARELFQFAAERLPFFMVPQFLEFISEIPKTANQKAQRYLLRSRPPGPGTVDRDSLGIHVVRPPR